MLDKYDNIQFLFETSRSSGFFSIMLSITASIYFCSWRLTSSCEDKLAFSSIISASVVFPSCLISASSSAAEEISRISSARLFSQSSGGPRKCYNIICYCRKLKIKLTFSRTELWIARKEGSNYQDYPASHCLSVLPRSLPVRIMCCRSKVQSFIC